MKKKILIVEDDSSLGLLLQFRFEQEGYQVVVAEDGKKAIDVLKFEHPDLVISDIMMPIMNGFDMVEQMRGPLDIRTPIILLSNTGLEEVVMRAYEVGANDFLSKPFIIRELMIKVERIFNQAS